MLQVLISRGAYAESVDNIATAAVVDRWFTTDFRLSERCFGLRCQPFDDANIQPREALVKSFAPISEKYGNYRAVKLFNLQEVEQVIEN